MLGIGGEFCQSTFAWNGGWWANETGCDYVGTAVDIEVKSKSNAENRNISGEASVLVPQSGTMPDKM